MIDAAELENGPVEVKRESERLGGGRWELMRFWEVSAVEVINGVETGSAAFGIDDLEVVKTCGSWVTIGMA